MDKNSVQSQVDKLANICNKLATAMGKITIFSILLFILSFDPTAPKWVEKASEAGRGVVMILSVITLYFFAKLYYTYKKEKASSLCNKDGSE